MSPMKRSLLLNFYPRPLRGGRLAAMGIPEGVVPISIHALCEEGDAATLLFILPENRFLSTPSARRATRDVVERYNEAQFLSTPSARRATAAVLVFYELDRISIHALCEEGDRPDRAVQPDQRDFYPRPLRGGRLASSSSTSVSKSFLSTPSARRATQYDFHVWRIHDISIHALCEEGDG